MNQTYRVKILNDLHRCMFKSNETVINPPITLSIPSEFSGYKYFKIKVIDYQIPELLTKDDLWMCITTYSDDIFNIYTGGNWTMQYPYRHMVFNLSDKNNIDNFERILPVNKNPVGVYFFSRTYDYKYIEYWNQMPSNDFFCVIVELSVDDTMK